MKRWFRQQGVRCRPVPCLPVVARSFPVLSGLHDGGVQIIPDTLAVTFRQRRQFLEISQGGIDLCLRGTGRVRA